MAGLGRRTHYRKHLTDSVINDLPTPQEEERIAKVVATRGGNQFDVLLALSDDAVVCTTAERNPRLCILPTKFRKLVFIKRGDYVIVDVGGEANEPDQAGDKEGGVRCIVKHILYKDQIKHLKAEGLWPLHDPEFTVSCEIAHNGPASTVSIEDQVVSEGQSQDGIVYDALYGETLGEEVMINTNRLACLALQDSSDSDEEC